MKLRPLNDCLIVKEIEERETTPTGIVLPDTAEKNWKKGKVVAVGPGRKDPATGEAVPPQLSPGDLILYVRFGAQAVAAGGEEFQMIKEHDVLAVCEG